MSGIRSGDSELSLSSFGGAELTKKFSSPKPGGFGQHKVDSCSVGLSIFALDCQLCLEFCE